MADSVTFGGMGAGGVGALDALHANATASSASAREAFGDFSALQAGSGRVSVGQTTGSADAAHAARVVASHVLES